MKTWGMVWGLLVAATVTIIVYQVKSPKAKPVLITRNDYYETFCIHNVEYIVFYQKNAIAAYTKDGEIKNCESGN